MSKTFLDRKNPDVPYVFISYSHADGDPDKPEKNYVGKMLTALNDLGANFWYDSKLRIGQDWFERVKAVTANKNCMGIIYIMSPDFMLSDACFKEFSLFDELKKTHDNFRACHILMDEEKPTDFYKFIDDARDKLRAKGLERDKAKIIRQNLEEYEDCFDPNILYCAIAKSDVDDDKFVRKLFADVFQAWGCASEETGKIDALVDDQLVNGDYRIKIKDCYMLTGIVNRSEAEWKAFSYNGNTLSAILVSEELYSATCRSLAKNAMAETNRLINISEKTDADEKIQQEKHFVFDPDFLECLIKDEDGNVIRFLRASEHTKNYLQLREALTKVPPTSAADDGYFFVTDNQDNVLFADRASDDVYRHIHVDAYASLFPVIDIDLNKYKEYIAKKN